MVGGRPHASALDKPKHARVWGPPFTQCGGHQAGPGAASTSEKTRGFLTWRSTRCRAPEIFGSRDGRDHRYSIFSELAAALDRIASDRLGLGQRLAMTPTEM